MLAKYNTLFVFEGNKTEDVVVSKMERHFMNGPFAIKCVFGGEIYQLYRKLMAEDFSVDIISLLKERSEENRKQLDGFNNDSFSYIYFFFDYDAHATKAKDAEVEEMVAFFNNETENGKLFVSYPMVEAVRHMKEKASFKELCVKCKRTNCPRLKECAEAEECLKEPHYKKFVPADSDSRFTNLNTFEIWKELVDAHLCKANYLVNDKYELPIRLIEQTEIFEKQISKHISQRCPKVAVLSAFPMFLQDYYGVEGLKEKLTSSCS